MGFGLGVGETIVVLGVLFFGTGIVVTYLFVSFFKSLFGKSRREVEKELEVLRAVNQSQEDRIRRLEGQVESLEAIVASSEYPALSRVSRGLEQLRDDVPFRNPHKTIAQ